MDPVSITLSFAGLVSLCAQVSKTVYTILGKSDDQDQALQSLISEVDFLQHVVKSLDISLKSIRPDRQRWPCIAHSLIECQRIMGTLDSMFNFKKGKVNSILENYMKPDGKSRRIELLTGQIAAHRQTLTISLIM